MRQGQQLASEQHPLGRLLYQGMDIEYFKRYVTQYVAGVSEVWPEFTAALAVYKPGLNETAISSKVSTARLYIH